VGKGSMKYFLVYGDNQTEGPITDLLELNRRLTAITKEHPTVRLERADMICDFCSWPRVAWTFTIAPGREMYTVIEHGEKEHHMDEDGLWAACDDCKNFIMEEDWQGMLERSVRNANALRTPMSGLPEPLIRVGITAAHRHFWAGWEQRGKPEPANLHLVSVGIADGERQFKVE
jgi:hypothetical protein